MASSACANPQLDPGNPAGFFTNAAMAMFQQMNLHDFNGNLVTVTNIPIYEDPAQFGGMNINYYTPAVHRILQLAANIYDATTNRFIGDGPTNYPTVFRPIFNSQNGIATIIGYQEVTNTDDAFLPMLNASDFVKVAQPVNSSVNISGVPWVIGAKKGFPNFNEFSMENALSVYRKIQFTNDNGFTGPPLWNTNQTYVLFITNTFGVEAWNSYTNSYGRPLRLIVTNELNINLTNQTGFSLLNVTNLSYGADTNIFPWPGWTMGGTDRNIMSSDGSFQVPLYISSIYTNGIYTQSFVFPLAPPTWTVTFQPRLWMSLRLKLRYVLIDTSADRVIDFVNLDSAQPPIDVTTILDNGSNGQESPSGNPSAQWDTNLVNGTLGIIQGIYNQIMAGEGAINPGDWRDTPQNIAAAQALFRKRLLNPVTNNFEDPYTPRATIYQRLSWQANDPLVHYLVSDLTSSNNTAAAEYNGVSLNAPLIPPLANIGSLNYAYAPWGGYHLPPQGGSQYSSPFDFDVRVKDPAIQQSDDWDFPTGEPLSFQWLGRVHRGTPWQTVFLKSSAQSLADWRRWANDNVFITNGNVVTIDAAFTYPTSDWQIAGLWDRWLKTNDLSTLLSINNLDTNAWAARLDGLIALTNSAYDELDSITVTSNSPPAEIIAQAIQTARTNNNAATGAVFPNQVFQDVGDVLAAPELSVASPFLNTVNMNSLSANGITDEALEMIPAQLIPLLRTDSFGQIAPANRRLQMSFSGYDGHAYAIEASSNLTDWVVISTNSPCDGNFGATNTATSDQQFYRSVLLH